MWTRFYDTASGGKEKTDWAEIYIELSEEDAINYFMDYFDLDPNNVSCECCGSDFAVAETSEEPSPKAGVLIIPLGTILNK